MHIRFLMGLLRLCVFCQPGAACAISIQSFPIELHDGLIWLHVDADSSRRPLNFLLDSGADVSVIDLATARELDLPLGRRVVVRGIHEKTFGYWPQHLKGDTNSLPLPANLLCVDLNVLGRACECRLDGLLGADFFREHVVQIDFAARTMRLLPAAGHDFAGNSLPLRQHHGALLVPVEVNHHENQWMRLDTGCAGALHWVTSTAEAHDLDSQPAIALTTLRVPMSRTTVRLGEESFDSVPTGLHSKRIFPGEAGLLGTGLLSKFRTVTVDAAAGRLLLSRN